jgi:hypothetical protein
MIEGLKVELTADELTRLLADRIDHHRDVASDCDARRMRLQGTTASDPDDTEQQLAAAWPHYLEHLERRAERHRARADALQFLCDHLTSPQRERHVTNGEWLAGSSATCAGQSIRQQRSDRR